MSLNGGLSLTSQLSLLSESTTSDGAAVVKHVSPAGVSSEASLLRGRLGIVISGVDAGTDQAERAVASIVLDLLRLTDPEAKPLPRAKDDHRQDGHFWYRGQLRDLEVVTVPRAQDYWAEARRGSASTSVELTAAIGWVREGIEAKGRKYSSARANCLYALDGRHAGFLAAPAVAAGYMQRYGDPAAEFSLGGVIVVGPSPSHSTVLGKLFGW